MIESDIDPKVTSYLTASTSCETVGISATVVQGSLFDILKNATWVVIDLPVKLDVNHSAMRDTTRKERIKASELGWTKAQVASLKARQSSFRDEWNAPGMEEYNDL